jgi:quercetin dioxygenase-like cupin family protein
MVAVALQVGALGVSVPGAEAPSGTSAELLRVDLRDGGRQELIVSRLEVAPGWSHGWHYHAGHEIVYVLEGAATLEMEGRAPLSLKPGMVGHVPPGRVHAGRNTGRTTLKVVLIQTHEKGQPASVELGASPKR